MIHESLQSLYVCTIFLRSGVSLVSSNSLMSQILKEHRLMMENCYRQPTEKCLAHLKAAALP